MGLTKSGGTGILPYSGQWNKTAPPLAPSPTAKVGSVFGGYTDIGSAPTNYVNRGSGYGVGQSIYANARPTSPVGYGGAGGGGGAAGPVLDPQMVEVEPPEMPQIARSGLMGASAGSGAGWGVQRIDPLDTSQLGKRIYPQGGTALTQRGRVY